MPDSVAIAAIVGGIILLILGLVPGAFEIFGAKFSSAASNKWIRTLCVFFGTLLIIISVGLEVFNQSPPSQSIFNATSYCSVRDVYGYGSGSNVNVAQDNAVRNCVSNGGIPNCCASNLRVDQQ